MGGGSRVGQLPHFPLSCTQGREARMLEEVMGDRSSGCRQGRRARGGCSTLLPVRLAAQPECPGEPVPGHRAGRFGGFGALEMGDGSAVPRAGSELLPVPSEPGLRAQQVSISHKPHTEPRPALRCMT